MNNNWQLQEAKSKFSQLVDQALSQGEQFVTRHGKPAVVVISVEKYRSLNRFQDSLVDFLVDSPLKGVGVEFERSKDTGREVEL